MIALERPVRFEEVDAAGIVFFGHFSAYAHDAMVHFFAALEGGYARLILERRVGLPAVRFDATFDAPARFGDVLVVETRVARLGSRSAVLRYGVLRKGAEEKGALAELSHTVVTTDLDRMASCEMPADVRALLEAHLEPEPETAEPARPARRA